MLIPLGHGIVIGGGSKVATILQNEAAECGLACLAMIATAHGQHVSLGELRRRFSVSAKGMSLRAMIAIGDAMGLAARPVRLDLDAMARLKLPAVLHWEMNHFVVLERVAKGRLLIHDPARGKRWINRGEADRSFTGVAVEFTPLDVFAQRKAADRVRLTDLFRNVRGLIPSVAQMFALAAIMQIFALVGPILNQLVIDEAITKGDADLLWVLAGGMFLLLLITTGVRLLQGMVGLYMGTQMSFQMRTNLLRHTLRLSTSWFDRRHVGDVLSRFASLQPVQDVLLNSGTAVVLNLLVGTASFVMMMIYSPFLSALQLAVVLIFLLIRLMTFPYLRRMTEEGLHLDAKVQTTFLESIRGARSFKLFGMERERVAIWQNEQARLVNNQVSIARFQLFGGSGTALLAGAQQIIVWFLGAKMVIDGDLTLGMLFAFQAYTAQFGGASSGLIAQAFVIRTMRVHLERLADIVHTEEEPGLDLPVDPTRAVAASVALKDVSFRYGDHEPWVLEKVSAEFKAGEFTCLIGPSGQGKTTILKLILGLEEPQGGEVLVDGVPLRRFGISTFRSRVGVVLQDDQLHAGTIADNISFFDIDPNEEEIQAAAQAAHIHAEITDFPMGYRTFIGDLGSTLSAGQRQRLLLARALYRKPSILVLDEGTANLDPRSEEAVMRTVSGLEITRIVVAHRPRAWAGSDRFYFVSADGIGEVQPPE